MQKACEVNYSDKLICKWREKKQCELGYKCGGGNDNSFQYSCHETPIDITACSLQSMGSQRVGHD